MNDNRQIEAAKYLDATGSIVESARLLANQVVNLMQQDLASIHLSFAGLRGSTSSYFTMFLREVVSRQSLEAYRQKVVCTFGSELQESVYLRSWDVVRREAA